MSPSGVREAGELAVAEGELLAGTAGGEDEGHRGKPERQYVNQFVASVGYQRQGVGPEAHPGLESHEEGIEYNCADVYFLEICSDGFTVMVVVMMVVFHK